MDTSTSRIKQKKRKNFEHLNKFSISRGYYLLILYKCSEYTSYLQIEIIPFVNRRDLT